MTAQREWRLDIYRDLGGEVILSLFAVAEDGNWSLVDAERFGPFDTATECAMWFVRKWAPLAKLPLR